MPIRLLVCVLLLVPTLALANLDAERLQAIRGKAFSACSNLLVHYNPNQDGSDSRFTERYRQDLLTLQQLVAQEGDPQLIQAAAAMRHSIDELERQPASNAQLYPAWINPLLKAQASLDQQAAKRYSAAVLDEPRLALHELSLNVARLQLLYQARTFGGLVVYVVDGDDNAFIQLDRQILQGFTALEHSWPQHAAELNKLKGKYDYVRPRLLKNEQRWVPGSAAYYLGQVTDGLASIGAK
ncbi:hypothetical protein E8E95_02755 [Pseudomonas sp. BN414]|uniref:hypothetical protein n=1 Tax=Pseudomonas TaxID=286 RepID=UPI0015BFA1DA|nr:MULTISPECIES: hypothetical protein [Pseudomonas]MDH4565592.1 hypothetical protein [Pseudomonas sp. BN414]NWL76017.1 hypothetical protein [Pseudomonas taiwanensis]